MAYFLFVDESGQDHRESPYEVLAGMAIEDRDLWNLVIALQEAEFRIFGRRYSSGNRELKAKKLLKVKTFKQAGLPLDVSEDELRILAKRCLDFGELANKRETAALAKAKLQYIREAFDICARYRCKSFASIVSKNSPAPNPNLLRKDYVYLFERFFYFLEDKNSSLAGIIVFDELEKSRSHILLNQMDNYFKHTQRGNQRASQIIPEPFFVHSDLTTGIQLADLVAYITSWGIRFAGMTEPSRPELQEFAEQIKRMRYKTVREIGDNPEYVIWSFAVINDLRSREEQEGQ